MKLDWSHLSKYRIRQGPMASDDTIGHYGAFAMKSDKRTGLTIIASSGDDADCGTTEWEHVSVKAHKLTHSGQEKEVRIPTWEEMCFVKSLFWDDDETVLQYHPAKTDYVNIHPHVLHLWKPKTQTIPLPPLDLV